MVRRWSRRRSRDSTPPTEQADDVRLDGDDHAWWAKSDVDKVWTPRSPRATAEPRDAERDILAEHFGDDWRTSFGFTPPTEAELAAEAAREQQAIDDKDPYKVLQVDESATWDEIVAAHRHQARAHHPDRLFGQSDEEKAEGEERIRVINQAYQELRVRRGM